MGLLARGDRPAAQAARTLILPRRSGPLPVLVGALISGEGHPGRVLAAVRREGIALVTSAFPLEELRAVLSRARIRPYIRPDEADDLLYHLEAVGVVVGGLPEVTASPLPSVRAGTSAA